MNVTIVVVIGEAGYITEVKWDEKKNPHEGATKKQDKITPQFGNGDYTLPDTLPDTLLDQPQPQLVDNSPVFNNYS